MIDIKIKQSPNFTKSASFKPIGYVIHGTLGAFDGAVDWLCTPPEKRNPVSYSSAHKVFARDGRVTQLIANYDLSWHAGRVNSPNTRAQAMIPKNGANLANPNSYFLGWEFEWYPGQNLTELQYQNAIECLKADGIVDLLDFYNHALSHKEITIDKTDDMLFAILELDKRLKSSVSSVPPITPPTPNQPGDKIKEGLALIEKGMALIRSA